MTHEGTPTRSDRMEFPIRSDKLAMSVRVTKHLYSGKSAFQQIDVVETDALGKVLLLDGHVQLATFDEKAYHESLVWVPLLSIPSPKKALVVGGGDGGVIREICKHESVRQIDMVEIDEAVVRVSQQHLPELSAGAFEDPRVNLHLTDAFEFVKASKDKYDLIVVDCTDVYEEEEGELSEMLFTQGFYSDLLRLLTDQGIVVTQADNLVFCPYSLEEVRRLFEGVFPTVGDYWGLVPSFGGFSGYVWGSKGARINPSPDMTGFQFSHLTPELVRASQSRLRFK